MLLFGPLCRCSSSFFAEERAALQRRRQKVRLLQQRKAAEVTEFKDLPEEIPLPLVIGTRVTGQHCQIQMAEMTLNILRNDL